MIINSLTLQRIQDFFSDTIFFLGFFQKKVKVCSLGQISREMGRGATNFSEILEKNGSSICTLFLNRKMVPIYDPVRN